MHLVVTYDIADDAVRRQVRRTLEGYGAWRQYSVFELDISESEHEELCSRLESHVESEAGDRVRLYRICETCDPSVTNVGAEVPEEKSNVV